MEHDVDARYERWRRTLDPGDLWPGVTASQLQHAQRTIAESAQNVLLGRPGELPDEHDITVLGIAAFTTGMGPLLGYWLEQGHMRAAPATVTLLTRHLTHGRRRWKILTQALRTVTDAYSERGIDAVVLKGMSTAFTVFPEPATRPAADIDLLVSPKDWDAAQHTLETLGFLPEQGQGLPYRFGWRHRDAPTTIPSLEMNHADSPWSLDLHRSLNRRFCGGIVAGFGSPAPLDGVSTARQGTAVRDLDEPWDLAFLAFHHSAHFDEMQLVKLVELVLVARQRFRTVASWERLLDLTRRLGTTRFLFPALELAERWVPGVLDPHVRGQLRAAAPPLMRRVVDRTTPATTWRQYTKSLDARLMWSTRPRAFARCLWEQLWPAPATSQPWREMLALQARRLHGVLRRRISLRR